MSAVASAASGAGSRPEPAGEPMPVRHPDPDRDLSGEPPV